MSIIAKNRQLVNKFLDLKGMLKWLAPSKFATRKRMDAESIAIGGMLTELAELEAPPIEFDEKLWYAVVERVTVYNDDRLVYSLKDGSEITVRL